MRALGLRLRRVVMGTIDIFEVCLVRKIVTYLQSDLNIMFLSVLLQQLYISTRTTMTSALSGETTASPICENQNTKAFLSLSFPICIL